MEFKSAILTPSVYRECLQRMSTGNVYREFYRECLQGMSTGNVISQFHFHKPGWIGHHSPSFSQHLRTLLWLQCRF
jgi:hypothetical protein